MKSELIQVMLHKNLDLLFNNLAVLVKLYKKMDGPLHHQLPRIIIHLLMNQLQSLQPHSHQLLDTQLLQILEVQVHQQLGQIKETTALLVLQHLEQIEEIPDLLVLQQLDPIEEILILQAHHQQHHNGDFNDNFTKQLIRI